MRDRQLVHPPTLRGEPILTHLPHGLRTGDPATIRALIAAIPTPSSGSHLILTGGLRHHLRAAAACINRPRATTSIAASANVNTPARVRQPPAFSTGDP